MSTVIDGYTLDVSASERHSFRASATRYPVERGADVTDHVQIFPPQLVVTGVVSDTPIGPIASEREEGVIPSEEALSLLTEVWSSRRAVTVETLIRTYDDMVIVSLEVPRDLRTGRALRFVATMQQIEIVDNERITVQIEEPRLRKKGKRGTKSSKSEADADVPATPEVTKKKNKSVWKQLTD